MNNQGIFILYILNYVYVPSIDLKSAIGFSDMRGKQKILSLPREHPGVTPGSGNDKTS